MKCERKQLKIFINSINSVLTNFNLNRIYLQLRKFTTHNSFFHGIAICLNVNVIGCRDKILKVIPFNNKCYFLFHATKIATKSIVSSDRKERKNSIHQHNFVCHSFNSDNAKVYSIFSLFFSSCRYYKNQNVQYLSFCISYSKFCAWIAPTVTMFV